MIALALGFVAVEPGVVVDDAFGRIIEGLEAQRRPHPLLAQKGQSLVSGDTP